MPDFAKVVLEAAKQEKQKDDAQQDAGQPQDNGDARPSKRSNMLSGTLYDSPASSSLSVNRHHDAKGKSKERGQQAMHPTTGTADHEEGNDEATREEDKDVKGLRGPFSAQEKSRGMSRLARSADSSQSGVTERGREGRDDRPPMAGRPSSMFGALARTVKARGRSDDAFEEDESLPSTPAANNERPKAATMMSTATGATNASAASGSHQAKQDDGPGAASRWAALRHKIRGDSTKAKGGFSKGLTGSELVRELSTGLLPIMMVKMALIDRDEHGGHRVPVLMNYLKLRITDSVYPFHNAHALFRIELEYGDGLMKWVIYREMRDFINLHAHYRLANFRASVDELPNFPKTSLPYFQALNKENREKGKKTLSKTEFARIQRDSLENYLLKLIRATMFLPQANRLCKFLEISALSLKLATGGGNQGKQGYLRVMSPGISRKSKPGFHPMAFKARHEPKWFIVRESYIVATDSPDSTEPFEVFMIDGDFHLERPKRLYRATFNKATANKFASKRDKEATADEGDAREDAQEEQMEATVGKNGVGDPNDPSTTDVAKTSPEELQNASLHTFYVSNMQTRLKLSAKNERQMDQFIASIERMAKRSIWGGKNRFDSFAPIRLNVAAQWLIDGRDYYWNLSRAILMAKEKIYIHDWWLSPELYMRRPCNENGKWRLDRLLQRKAEEGVKIFVIIYNQVSDAFTPVDSHYTKTRLLGLHPNIQVQRSPSHTQTRTLLWSHHEKMCVIDETIAFMGGFDLCFGRWDTPQHTLVDEGTAGLEAFDQAFDGAGEDVKTEDAQLWPGKDYANSRVSDWHNLHHPEQDMYDRTKVPRQAWHDIGLQIVGQPARDLCRHFIMRWNHLLRTKNHTRYMPFLLPPPDFTAAELEKKRIAGTVEAQICRSCGPWSMGTPKRVEHSIQTAYIKAIQLSDHFVYIENQFFVTSTVADGVVIENQIGDALVDRIIRAHHEGTPWRAIILIPLVPGYPMPLDSPDAGSVRMIMECQNCSMFRGDNSIFGRLRHAGVPPEDYISFFSLRSWGKLKSGLLCTQDIYIHAKAMIVDDRIVIIGSANINERSQRGDRDSELACVLRDTDMVDGVMAGQPYKVGRFARSMRIRLMREHLGVDVDGLETAAADGDLLSRPPVQSEEGQKAWDPDKQQEHGIGDENASKALHFGQATGRSVLSAAQNAGQIFTGVGEMFSQGRRKAQGDLANVAEEAKGTTSGDGEEKKAGELGEAERIARGDAATDTERAQSAAVPTVEEQLSNGDDVSTSERHRRPSVRYAEGTATPSDNESREADPGRDRRKSVGARSAKSSIGTPTDYRLRAALGGKMSIYSIPTPAPEIDVYGFDDPIADSFYHDVWSAVASRNTQIYRKVFRCTPDDLCLTWGQFKEWDLWGKRHEKSVREHPGGDPTSTTSGGPGAAVSEHTKTPVSPTSDTHAGLLKERKSKAEDEEEFSRTGTSKSLDASVAPAPGDKKTKALKITDEGFSSEELDQMEELLQQVSGNLVLFPTRFLESEDLASNFLFQRDRIQPMNIFN